MEEITIDNKYVQIWLEDGIIYSVYKPNLVINLKIAKQLVNDRLKVSNGIERPLFVDMSNMVYIDLEARKYLSSQEASQFVNAGALYTNVPISNLVGKLFIDVNRPVTPSKLFAKKHEAIKWLKEYVNN